MVNIWNAQLTTTTAGANASNVSYNGSLAPGASTSFGFQVAGPSAP
ncbi:cellulose binding domain-containing protein [Ferrimicrobium acidiphilum]